MLSSAYRYLIDRSGSVRRIRTGLLYWLAALFLRDSAVVFMNYGYSPIASGTPLPALLPEDVANRLPIQLYHRLTGEVELEGQTVLEVSCGRGGGASYLMRYRRPQSLLGVDRSRPSVDFCRRRHRIPGLAFSAHDAEVLDLPSQSFDVVVNVEASHCYGRMDRFLQAVRNVVRPEGHLVWADFRAVAKVPTLRREFVAAGWQIDLEEDITANVLQAMEMEDRRWNTLIEERVPSPFRPAFRETAGVRGSHIQGSMRDGKIAYLRSVLRKG